MQQIGWRNNKTSRMINHALLIIISIIFNLIRDGLKQTYHHCTVAILKKWSRNNLHFTIFLQRWSNLLFDIPWNLPEKLKKISVVHENLPCKIFIILIANDHPPSINKNKEVTSFCDKSRHLFLWQTNRTRLFKHWY